MKEQFHLNTTKVVVALKLIGSMTEQSYRAELLASHRSLFCNEVKHRMLSVLQMRFNDMKTAYILDWVPDQDEDCYWILIDDKFVVQIELERGTSKVIDDAELISLSEYKKGLSKTRQIKLAVALDLAKKDIASK
jgi:hypothetical protein